MLSASSSAVTYMNELFCLIKSTSGKIQAKFQYELIHVNVSRDVTLKPELRLQKP